VLVIDSDRKLIYFIDREFEVLVPFVSSWRVRLSAGIYLDFEDDGGCVEYLVGFPEQKSVLELLGAFDGDWECTGEWLSEIALSIADGVSGG
jgi:hypothetical protein